MSALLRATRRTNRHSLIFPSVKRTVDLDEPIDGLEELEGTGYVPIDDVSFEMLRPDYQEDPDDRESRIWADDAGDPLDILIAREEAGSNVFADGDDEWGNNMELPREGDEAIPMNGSRLHEVFRQTRDQENNRIHHYYSHGIHGRKPTKPKRVTIRKAD